MLFFSLFVRLCRGLQEHPESPVPQDLRVEGWAQFIVFSMYVGMDGDLSKICLCLNVISATSPLSTSGSYWCRRKRREARHEGSKGNWAQWLCNVSFVKLFLLIYIPLMSRCLLWCIVGDNRHPGSAREDRPSRTPGAAREGRTRRSPRHPRTFGLFSLVFFCLILLLAVS